MNQVILDATQGLHSLYSPAHEHDACGVGFIAQVSGKRSNQVLQYALQSLCDLAHRGAVDADAKTGDGAGVVTLSGSASDFSGHIGLPLPSVEIAIKNDDGDSLAPGEAGEICIKGPNVTIGYFNKPDENARTFTADGFMRTGDIGIMSPDGTTRIVDRKKDMIIVSGFNVYPNELENVISTCPGVVECAAVGIPDTMQGETIKVFVVRSDPMLTEEAVARFCQQNLTGYKRPKYIEFRDELPKSNVGKILRRELRSGK